MYRYRYRLRVILLSLGVVLGYGSAAAQLFRHHGAYGFDRNGFHHACSDWSWSPPWSADPDPHSTPPPANGAPAPKHVQ